MECLALPSSADGAACSEDAPSPSSLGSCLSNKEPLLETKDLYIQSLHGEGSTRVPFQSLFMLLRSHAMEDKVAGERDHAG